MLKGDPAPTLCHFLILIILSLTGNQTSKLRYDFLNFDENGRCQSLLQSTSVGSNPLLMMNVKVY